MEVQSSKANLPSSSKSPRTGAQSTGVVIPHPLNWHQRLAASVVYGLIEGVALTQRCRWEYHPEVLKPIGSVIFSIWHNRLPFSLIMYRRYARQKKQPHQMAAIVSASKDGGVVARILEHFGVQPVRGSSSRRGPRYVVQPGAMALAQLTGRPLVPVSYHLSWKICLKSWDRFQIPLPFGRAVMKFGEPLRVPREASDQQREILRQQLEQRMRNLTIDS